MFWRTARPLRTARSRSARNALIGFMTWEGYNYEDAVLLNEKIVRDDVYTSIHIEEYEMEARDTKLGAEEITRDIPNVNEDLLRDLDDRGIIRVGRRFTPAIFWSVRSRRRAKPS